MKHKIHNEMKPLSFPTNRGCHRRDGLWSGTGRIRLTDVRTWLTFRTEGRTHLGIGIGSEEGRSRPTGLASGNIVINAHHCYFYSTLHMFHIFQILF